ncbi:MAG: S8 family serine peptidase [Bdellovibrionales bacterium]
MFRPPNPIFILFLVLFSMPFFFNSCQAGLISSKGFRSYSASCKAGYQKGKVVPYEEMRSPFADQKVRIAGALGSTGASKPTATIIEAGTPLVLVVNNQCLLENRGGDLTSSIAQETVLAGLEQQSYSWSPEKDISQSELERIAEADPCVVGLSKNRTFTLQTYNDPQAFYQSHLASIHAEEAYPLFYDSSGAMDRRTSKAVVIAVVDTGTDASHPDLTGALWRHQAGFGIDITTVGTSQVSYNPLDVSGIGHGTHVAGLIGATSDNGVGTQGAMPFRAQIMTIKLFRRQTDGSLTTTSQDLANAIEFAYLNGAQVINLSLGDLKNESYPQYDQSGNQVDGAEMNAVTRAVNSGVTVVTVTGNAASGALGKNIDGVTFTSIPAMYSTREGVLGVGSYDIQTGEKSFFSHFSTTYGEIAAPGAETGTTGLYSTLPGSTYGRLAGTSQAGPLVSAAAGLVIGLIQNAYGQPPTPAEVERLILASAEKSSQLSPFFKSGNRLNLKALADLVHREYPATGSGSGSISLSSLSCPRN